MRKKAFQAAFPYTIPIFAGFWFLALAYGIYMNANGFPFVYPMLMSLLIYGGSLEFVAVEITKEPKAKTFRRTVSIPHFLTQRIKALRRERLKYRLTLGGLLARRGMAVHSGKRETDGLLHPILGFSGRDHPL